MTDPFAAKRAAMRDEFFAKLFLLGGWLGAPTRTSGPCGRPCRTSPWPAPATRSPSASRCPSRGPAAGSSWPATRPCSPSGSTARCNGPTSNWPAAGSATAPRFGPFPDELWDGVLASQPGDDIFLPVDVWGFPGGQTFLAGVPCLSFEGHGRGRVVPGAGHVPVLRPGHSGDQGPADGAATPRDAEFGLRSAPVEVCNLILLLARYVGGRGQADFERHGRIPLPRTVPIRRHHRPRDDVRRSVVRPHLADAEYEMMDRFVTRMGTASLLCDLVDAETVGLENALRVIRPTRRPTASASGSTAATSPASASCTSRK